MEIKLAKTAGFCFGVNRAVDMLYKMVAQGEKVCTLGPIIHNPQVIADLESKGVVIANSLSAMLGFDEVEEKEKNGMVLG